MAKKAALSVRISATVKKGLDRAARADKRSTSALVEIILADYLARAGKGKSKIHPEEHLAAADQALDLQIPKGKKLGDSTGVGRAYGEIAKQMKTGEQARKHKSSSPLPRRRAFIV